ncbi:pericentriolar material 1 protein isoform X4 [Hyposmocoma kahamanoa]|uniref:pericentriolar material 1 protein isoform X4 n=1 Tax=Hyposmocoma kahamanoa TaxID=1477025 RepID=UPI000E6D5BCB|nr:pericentriolar material 1 protein isoform X4 [Hyposmocoma kahamanoa]
MAPGNNERHPGHTGTIPKTKVRNNCNVPQEAVTPTRRDMATNLVSTSLDWVPVSEYNTRANYNQSRKQTNNSSDHELTDLDNSVSFESGFGRFVPVRPQPRVLPLNVQNQNIASDTNDEGAGSSASGHSLHPYAHQMQNGLIPHSNHAAAAVMIVNPTTPNAVTGSMSQPFNAPNQNRSNLTRNVNPARNNFEGNSLLSNNNTTPPVSNARTATKTVNIMNNMYDQGQGGFNNINENNHIAHRESARTLGEAIVAACPDAAAVERRLGQIREYIRVTSSLVDTMRNSEDEQDVIVRPVSVQSNGSAYSENELWQNEIKNKMEMSSMRLAALKQQQKRLLKYQEEAKQQLDEMNRERQSQELHPATSHDNFANMQTQTFGGNFHHPNRMYAANQIGVATTLPHSSEAMHVQQNLSNIENDHGHAVHAVHNQDERFSHREANIASSEEAAGGGRDSDGEEDEGLLGERARLLQMKLRELQLKKQHMESLVTEFQKLQMATRAGSSRNTYSSSGEDSGAEESTRKCNNAGGGNIKNEDPFKLMEIKAIKTALQKTKDLMRSVENYEADHLSAHDETFQVPSHSNINDNKSEGGGSMGGWSNEGSVCRVRNTLPQRHKFTNEQHSLQQQQQQQQQSHEANIATLQELAQELRLETEKIMGERARIKDVVSNKELARKQKKVNEEVRPGPSGVSAPGPAERRQMQLRALLAEKQRELEALLNKENVLCSGPEPQKQKPDSRTGSIVNQSYTSEQEEPDSRSEQILLDSQNSQENENFRAGGDSALGNRSLNTVPSHLGSTYGSDSDSASRKQSNQRNRARRRQPQDRQVDDNNAPQVNNTSQNLRHEARPEASNVNMVPPSSSGDNPANMPYPHLQQPCWNSNKANQFTQNSHSQTMDRLLGTPQMSFPPSVPFNMMMPYGMVGGCGCGCSFWGAWCWQQIVMQQREIHQLREQLNHLEERWRAENASHTLNNQVPPGNRANNYWDNFRSYSRQNLLSTNNKTNADGHLAVGPAHNPHPLVERSHNTLHHTSTSTSPSITPKRNTNASSSTQNATAQQSQTHNEEIPNRQGRRNISYERSLSFSSAPDVLNVNQNSEDAPTSLSRNIDDSNNTTNNVNINRQEGATNAFRNLNITNPIPEIIQSHSNNLNTTANSKKKSSSKLPAKNSTNRRNYTGLDYSQTSNINIASTSEAPNPNLASTSRKVHDKATSKLFDLLRENVYSEVTALIDVNESHPDFLIQLFRELQLISSDPLRQRVLQSIRTVLTQYASFIDGQRNENLHEENRPEGVSTTSNDANNYQDFNSLSSTMQIDNKIVRFLLLKSEEMFTPELMDSLASLILNATSDLRQSQQSKKKVLELLSKYEGMRVCDVSSDIIENLPVFISGNNEGQESSQLTSELSESSIFQDVAGSLNLFSSSDTQLHQMNACPYDMWSGHMHMDIEGNDDTSPLSSQEGKMDLINCSEMHNGDLAEADQTHDDEGDNAENHEEMGANAEALPDVVDTDEVTPTEAEVEWLGLDRVPTRLHMEESSEKQKD